jgi:hypothetical protein
MLAPSREGPCPLLFARSKILRLALPEKLVWLAPSCPHRAGKQGSFGHLRYLLYLPRQRRAPTIVRAYHFSLLNTVPAYRRRFDFRNTKFGLLTLTFELHKCASHSQRSAVLCGIKRFSLKKPALTLNFRFSRFSHFDFRVSCPQFSISSLFYLKLRTDN